MHYAITLTKPVNIKVNLSTGFQKSDFLGKQTEKWISTNETILIKLFATLVTADKVTA